MNTLLRLSLRLFCFYTIVFLENNTLAHHYILWTILLDNNPLLPEHLFYKQYFGQARSQADTCKPINENCWTPLLWVLDNTSILENTRILVYENVSGHPPADPINPSVVQHDQAIRFQWRLLFCVGKKYSLEAKTIFMTKNFFYRGSYYDYEQLLFFL